MRRDRRAPLNSIGNTTAVVADLAGELPERAFRWLGMACNGSVVDAGRHDRDTDNAFQAFVECGTDDDVGVLIDLFPDAGGSFVDLVSVSLCRP